MRSRRARRRLCRARAWVPPRLRPGRRPPLRQRRRTRRLWRRRLALAPPQMRPPALPLPARLSPRQPRRCSPRACPGTKCLHSPLPSRRMLLRWCLRRWKKQLRGRRRLWCPLSCRPAWRPRSRTCRRGLLRRRSPSARLCWACPLPAAARQMMMMRRRRMCTESSLVTQSPPAPAAGPPAMRRRCQQAGRTPKAMHSPRRVTWRRPQARRMRRPRRLGNEWGHRNCMYISLATLRVAGLNRLLMFMCSIWLASHTACATVSPLAHSIFATPATRLPVTLSTHTPAHNHGRRQHAGGQPSAGGVPQKGDAAAEAGAGRRGRRPARAV